MKKRKKRTKRAKRHTLSKKQKAARTKILGSIKLTFKQSRSRWRKAKLGKIPARLWPEGHPFS